MRLPPASGAPFPRWKGFDAGEWWVQDAAACLPAKLFGDLSGKRVADLCAAPGGKTAQLALTGGVVTALDQSGNRLKRLIGNLERLGLSATTVEANMADYKPDELFDAVLLDAPCSSTGTIRRHPDVLWTRGAGRHQEARAVAGAPVAPRADAGETRRRACLLQLLA